MLDKNRLEQLELVMAEFAMKQDRMLGQITHLITDQQTVVRVLDHHSDQIKFLLRKQGEMAEKLNHIETKVDAVDGKVDAVDGKVDAVDAKVDALDLKMTTLDAKMTTVATSLNLVLTLLRQK